MASGHTSRRQSATVQNPEQRPLAVRPPVTMAAGFGGVGWDRVNRPVTNRPPISPARLAVVLPGDRVFCPNTIARGRVVATSPEACTFISDDTGHLHHVAWADVWLNVSADPAATTPIKGNAGQIVALIQEFLTWREAAEGIASQPFPPSYFAKSRAYDRAFADLLNPAAAQGEQSELRREAAMQGKSLAAFLGEIIAQQRKTIAAALRPALRRVA